MISPFFENNVQKKVDVQSPANSASAHNSASAFIHIKFHPRIDYPSAGLLSYRAKLGANNPTGLLPKDPLSSSICLKATESQGRKRVSNIWPTRWMWPTEVLYPVRVLVWLPRISGITSICVSQCGVQCHSLNGLLPCSGPRNNPSVALIPTQGRFCPSCTSTARVKRRHSGFLEWQSGGLLPALHLIPPH